MENSIYLHQNTVLFYFFDKMTKEELLKWCKENNIQPIEVPPPRFHLESEMEREAREAEKAFECPVDHSKYICHNCGKAFPKEKVEWIWKDGEITSIDRTVYNGIITVDYNHYNKIQVPICEDCKSSIKLQTRIFLFFKYGFFIGGGAGILYAIISACMGETDLFGDFTVIFIFFIMMLGIISGLIFNNRRYYPK